MLHKFRNALVNREAKIIQMEQAFEPSERVKAYSQTSLDIVRQDYIAAVKEAQSADKARLAAIELKYAQRQPSLESKHQQLALHQSELRSLSVPQLKARIADSLTFPPFLSDIIEIRALGAEARERGLLDAADDLAMFVQTQNVANPHVHDPEYKRIDSRIKKMDAYSQQAQEGNMLILAENPEHVSQGDIITLDGLKANLEPARGVSS